MLQSIAAVIAGFVAMAVAVTAGSALAKALTKPMASAGTGGTGTVGEEAAAPGSLVFDFALGMAAAAIGGTVTATFAPGAVLRHSLALAGAVLGMSVVCLLRPGQGVPRWYMAVLSLSSAAVVVACGWFVSRHG